VRDTRAQRDARRPVVADNVRQLVPEDVRSEAA